METLQDRTSATQEAIALAVDHYKQTVDTAIDLEDFEMLTTAVPNFYAMLFPLIGVAEIKTILNRLYADNVADGL
jgi:hypothetical protein